MAGTQVFPVPSVMAEAAAAYLMGPNGTAVASKTNAIPTAQYNAGEYETVAASQTDQVLGATGAIGDYLDRIVIFVATAATGAVTIKDGATTIGSFANSPGGGIGPYVLQLGIRAVGAGFSITTGAGSSVLAIGDFT